MAKININERSWGIDVISLVNAFVANKDIAIKSAGGENTLSGAKNSLFPDLLLFSDTNKSGILQGWELKMPDTAINNEEFISNAEKKARLLSLDSFLLWNVSVAVLYVKANEEFIPTQTWEIPNGLIRTRQDVETHSKEWKSLLNVILTDLNTLFTNGTIRRKTLIENLSFSAIIDVILENSTETAERIRTLESRNARLRSEINLWWLSAKFEYNDSDNPYDTLAKVVLTNWVVKILFANILKKYFNDAQVVETINFDSSVEDGVNIFQNISASCDFWNIFSPQLAQNTISPEVWNKLIQINSLLADINLNSIDTVLLQDLLQTSILKSSRRIAGQFTTPKILAELLVKLTVDNIDSNIIDPCCGMGTIINEAFRLKTQYNIPEDRILETTWASDKYAFPLQLATLLLSKPANFGKILKIFRSDVTNLTVGNDIDFINPTNGNQLQIPLPTFDNIVSNLPFVQQEDLGLLNPNVASINTWIKEQTGENIILSGKSDLYAYIPFYLYRLLNENGKIGLIVSNAWLGTGYGVNFISLLRKFFTIESIVISGKDKWFKNADVVTTIIVLKKKTDLEALFNVRFCVLNNGLNEVENVEAFANPIILNRPNENVSIQEYTTDEITHLQSFGLAWNSFFAELKWIFALEDKLINVNQIFDIGRGERRGWNAMFYPENNHGIEAEYIKPVLKNLRNCTSLIATPNKIAFSCSQSEAELRRLNHRGALNWIRKFEVLTNTDGTPLTTTLRRANHFWYEMKADTMADFVANINYDKSLFVARLNERAFVDQRVIPFILKHEHANLNRDLLHALLNSVLSMFFLEALGFGRGLGALDLSSTRIELNFRILNPATLNNASQERIIRAFHPLLERDRLPLELELENQERQNFEEVLFTEFAILGYYPLVKNALIQLYRIRFAVKN